jgi:uncharacterized protein (DUF1778 family)
MRWDAGVGQFTMLSFRLPKAHALIVDRAASLQQKKRSEFLREAILREAEAVIMSDHKAQRKMRRTQE